VPEGNTEGEVDEGEAEEGGDGEDTASIMYDSVTRIFDSDGDGLITEGDLEANAALVQEALTVLIPDYAMSLGRRAQAAGAASTGLTPTDEMKFQAGMYAAVDAVRFRGVVEPGDQLILVGKAKSPRPVAAFLRRRGSSAGSWSSSEK
jgi:hypothetical protein